MIRKLFKLLFECWNAYALKIRLICMFSALLDTNMLFCYQGGGQVLIQVQNLINDLTELAVTFDGIALSLTSISEFSADAEVATFKITCPTVDSANAGGKVQVLVQNVNNGLSVNFRITITTPPNAEFGEVVPPFKTLSSDPMELEITIRNVHTYNLTSMQVKFTPPGSAPVYGTGLQVQVIEDPTEPIVKILLLSLTIPSGIASGRSAVQVQLSTASANMVSFFYNIKVPPPQITSLVPASAHSYETIVIGVNNLDMPARTGVTVTFTTSATLGTMQVFTAVIIAVDNAQSTVTVQVPHMSCNTCADVPSIDISVSTNTSSEPAQGRTFEWLAPKMPSAGLLEPHDGLSFGGFQIKCEIIDLVSSFLDATLPPSENDFTVTLGGSNITTFSVGRAFDDAYEIHFTAPTMSPGIFELVVALAAESFKRVAWLFQVHTAGDIRVSGSLSPSSCYTQGGGIVSALVDNYPPNTAANALVKFTDMITGTVYSNVTASKTFQDTNTDGTTKIGIQFKIPASQISTSHTESLKLEFPTNPPVTITETFNYVALPAPVVQSLWILDTDDTWVRNSRMSYTGGTSMRVSVRNLGKQSESSVLVAVFAYKFQARDPMIVCDPYNSESCEAGLVQCTVLLVSPQMLSLTALGDIPLQIYWSDHGIARAASTQVEVYNPQQARVIQIYPHEGYMTEPTVVQALVINLEVAGSAGTKIYPSVRAMSANVRYTVDGSTIEVTATIVDAQTITFEGSLVSNITLQIPAYNSTSTGTVPVDLILTHKLNTATQTSAFTYHPVPNSAPELLAPVSSVTLPLTGPLEGGTYLIIDLASFLVCPSVADVVIKFVDPTLSKYPWVVQWVSSSMQRTQIGVITPQVPNHLAVNSNTGIAQVFAVQVYPRKLQADKVNFGSSNIYFQYESGAAVTYLSSATGSVIGGEIVEMLIEASFDIVAALPSYYFGNTRVTSISHSSSSFDQKHMRVSFSVPASTSAGIKAIRVTFANGQADAVSIAIEVHRSLTSLPGRYCRCAFHKPVVDTITLHCLEMP